LYTNKSVTHPVLLPTPTHKTLTGKPEFKESDPL